MFLQHSLIPTIADAILRKIAKILHVSKRSLSIFDANNYSNMDAQFNYTANIFVLGDSLYNLGTFEAAIRLRSHHERNYLYFHDGLYTNLLHSWIVKYRYKWANFLKNYYPPILQKENHGTEYLLKENIRMIYPVTQLTGTTKIIVNADNCIPIIQNEIKRNIHYVKAYLPIPDYRNISPVACKKENELIVAHFGMPNVFKHLEVLIKAIFLLRQKQVNIKIIISWIRR